MEYNFLVNYPSNTRNFSLPMDEGELNSLLSSYPSVQVLESDLNCGEFVDLKLINEILSILEEKGNLKHATLLFAIYLNMEDLLDMVLEDRYFVIPARNEEELGEYVVENNLLNIEGIDFSIIPPSYLDFNAIGIDYSVSNYAQNYQNHYIFAN